MLPQSKRMYIATLCLLGVLCVVAWVVWYVYTDPEGPHARKNADLHLALQEPTATYTDLDGNPVSLEQFEGKVLLVNMWASWSPFTQPDFKILSDLQIEFGDTIQILALNRMEPKNTARAYLEYINSPDTITYVLDETDHFFKNFDGYAMPETVLFDAVGNLVFRVRGSLMHDEIQAKISSLLEKN